MESKARLLGHPNNAYCLSTRIARYWRGFRYCRPCRRRRGAVEDFILDDRWRNNRRLAGTIFGLADWLAIPSGTRAQRIGLWHGAGNVVVVLLFIVSWFCVVLRLRLLPQQHS